MASLAVLYGPTAVGKTALSIPIARALDAEIVNVDSRQIYRFMDIGTAKPTAAQCAQVPHHLLNILLPDQGSSAASFVEAAWQVIDELLQRGKRPLIVASSGLYLQALLYGLMAAPSADKPLRRKLHAYADRYGTATLHQRLQVVDPLAALQYHPHDRIRLVRALEVTYLTGEPFSSHVQRHQQQGSVHPHIGFGLTRERSELYARIAERTNAMLTAGWLVEVRSLLARGYTRKCAAMNSLGYRELLMYLDGQISWLDAVTAIKQVTRRLAKRQLTWLRKFPALHEINLSTVGEKNAVASIIEQLR
ncbi:MAG: tRNA (adenosine(37)-N6)-dimethylallyltransferase MiaA [bacterium]|nr:tRNA (adenosine(37)-N6)-dimethylallyltransferase MiaA [bacterium]